MNLSTGFEPSASAAEYAPPRSDSPDLRGQDLAALRAQGVRMVENLKTGKVHRINLPCEEDGTIRSDGEFARKKGIDRSNLGKVLRSPDRVTFSGFKRPEGVEPYKALSKEECGQKVKLSTTYEFRQNNSRVLLGARWGKRDKGQG
jgi:hypothetical protein